MTSDARAACDLLAFSIDLGPHDAMRGRSRKLAHFDRAIDQSAGGVSEGDEQDSVMDKYVGKLTANRARVILSQRG